MWQPPERIKHELPPTAWPTAEEAAQALMFQPIELGPRTACARTWIPAMVPWRATEDGFVTPDVIAWYRRFAEGRPGVLVVEATAIRDVPSGPLLRIGHDRFVEGLAQLVSAVREASNGQTLVLIQLIDFLSIRRRPARDKYFSRFLTITERHREALRLLSPDPATALVTDDDVRAHLTALPDTDLPYVLTARELEDLERGYRERVTDTHLPHIKELPQVLPGLFADAAARAEAAGFDGVELHFAHAYTMASFLSALNTRDDGYGGKRPHRARLPLEVIAAVKERTARNVSLSGTIRAAVRAAGLTTPIVGAGGLCEFAQAEAVLARGEADLVASARQSLADPDWFQKIRLGRGDEIRRCEFTNYCEALDQQHKQVTCKLWDREELDAPDVTLASDGKRRLIAPKWRR